MGPNQTYKLLHSKGNHKKSKRTTYGMGENICKWCNQQGLSCQDIQTTYTRQQQQKLKTQSKNRRLKYTFFQRRYTDGQQAPEKMLNIANY